MTLIFMFFFFLKSSVFVPITEKSLQRTLSVIINLSNQMLQILYVVKLLYMFWRIENKDGLSYVFQKELNNFRMCIITFTSVSKVEGKYLLDESAYFLTFLLNDNQPRSTIYDELNLSIFCITLSSTFFRDFLSIMYLSMYVSVCVCSCLCTFLFMCVPL